MFLGFYRSDLNQLIGIPSMSHMLGEVVIAWTGHIIFLHFHNLSTQLSILILKCKDNR